MAKAMILAAGLGTRLKPITLTKPKALAEVDGITLLEYSIKHLKRYGFDDIIINVHHFADQVIEFLKKKNDFGVHLTISDEREQLLNTGGGLKKASGFFNDDKPFLMYNVDVLSDINLNNLYHTHIESNAIVTLAVRGRKTSRYFLFDQAGCLCGWKNMSTNQIIITSRSVSKLQPFAFSGIQVINPGLLEMISLNEGPFSITEVYIKLCANYKIMAYNHDNSFWMDMGTAESIAIAEELLSKCNFLLLRD